MSAEEIYNAAILAETINAIPAQDNAFLYGIVVGMRQANRTSREEEKKNAES